MRKKILIFNWKMHKTETESVEFIKNCASTIEKIGKNVDICLAPSFTSLSKIANIAPKNLIIASQNVHYLSCGAYTGEISTDMLKDIKVFYSIVGHSERRMYCNETDEKCNLKIKKLISENMVPIFCCGESLDIYKKKQTKEFIEKQIISGFNGISKDDAAKVLIAYEPVWAIGTGHNADKTTIEKMCLYIRQIFEKIYDKNVSEKIRILYGGSVNFFNVKEYVNSNNIDGVLIGSASLDVKNFNNILLNF